MIDYLMLDRWICTAGAQRRLAATATSDAERAHYLLEAERFDELAELLKVDPIAARRAYRPTRIYEPANV